MEIPLHICEAVYSGQMPFGILADWLEDNNWSSAAVGVRVFDARGVTIETLQVFSEGAPLIWSDLSRSYPLWKVGRDASDVQLLVETLAWTSVTFRPYHVEAAKCTIPKVVQGKGRMPHLQSEANTVRTENMPPLS